MRPSARLTRGTKRGPAHRPGRARGAAGRGARGANFGPGRGARGADPRPVAPRPALSKGPPEQAYRVRPQADCGSSPYWNRSCCSKSHTISCTCFHLSTLFLDAVKVCCMSLLALHSVLAAASSCKCMSFVRVQGNLAACWEFRARAGNL